VEVLELTKAVDLLYWGVVVVVSSLTVVFAVVELNILEVLVVGNGVDVTVILLSDVVIV
jgi:hypothetical protein